LRETFGLVSLTSGDAIGVDINNQLKKDRLLAMATLQFPAIKTEQSILGFNSYFKRRDGFLMKKGESRNSVPLLKSSSLRLT